MAEIDDDAVQYLIDAGFTPDELHKIGHDLRFSAVISEAGENGVTARWPDLDPDSDKYRALLRVFRRFSSLA